MAVSSCVLARRNWGRVLSYIALGWMLWAANLKASEPTPPSTPRNVTFIVTSDVHYDAFENEDRNDRVRDTIRAINNVTNLVWPDACGGGAITNVRGVLVLGDIIDDGDRILLGKHQTARQWYQFAADFGFDGTDGVLNYPVFETWGNHDGPPAGAEKHGFSFQARFRERNLRRQKMGWLANLSTNGLHYSWDWDDVHFVMLGLYPADRQMMPVLFDSGFGEFPDLEHYRDKDWMACPGQNHLGAEEWPKLEQYVRDVVGPHRTDSRIVMWDVMNANLETARQLFPERPPSVLEEDGVTFQGFWTRWTGNGPLQGRLYFSSETNDTASFAFTGSSVVLLHKVGPDCGMLRVLIDGRPSAKPEIDTFSSTVEWNHRTVLANNLSDERHVVQLQPTGKKNSRASHHYVQIVGFDAPARLPLRMLLNTPLRDTSICRGPDGTWYMTGTVEPFWAFNEGIKLWKSPDLTNWTALGFVWKYGASPWHKPYLDKKKPLWAPEVHYLKGTFWLTYSMPGWDNTAKTSGSGLLKSTTGQPEGPYVDMQPGERLGDEIDASLFEDDDGTVYFLWHCGKIARLKPDLSGLAEPYRWLKTTTTDPNPRHHSSLCAGIFGTNSFDHVGYEGMFLFKWNGRYYLSCSEIFEGRYSCTVATATHLFGPYGARYEAIPHAGHNNFFQDPHGQWWSTYFGSDDTAPWQERPGVLPIEFDQTGRLRPKTR